MDKKQKEFVKTKELVNKIVSYATEMISSKFEYKTYYDEYQKQEIQYKLLKIELDNPNKFKYKRDKQISWIHQPPKLGYYKINYVYPELENKKVELKTLEKQIAINSTKASFAHNRYAINQHLLYTFINNLETEKLKQIIEYLDINMFNNYSNTPSYDMTNAIYKSVINDIENLFSSDIKVDLSEKYRGTITIIEILIDHKELCENCINTYLKVKQEFDNTKKQLANSEILEKKLNENINKIEKFIFNRIFEPNKLRQLKNELKEIEYKIGMLLSIQNFNLDHTLYPAKINMKNSYRKYSGLYFYLNQMIDSLGERAVRELIEKLNININIQNSNDNYFDEIAEMKKILKKWFKEENKKVARQIDIGEEQLIVSECLDDKMLIRKGGGFVG